LGQRNPYRWSGHPDADQYHRNILKLLVADAVLVEPLSTPKFPANREKNREFRNIAALGVPETTINSVVIGFPMRIPYSTEQEIILPEQGLLAKEQGILSAGVEFTAREGPLLSVVSTDRRNTLS
jgi:RNase H-fold protein (predicted Holliday junction resolvase)